MSDQAMTQRRPEEIFACDLDGGWIWQHGHVDLQAFRDYCLAHVNDWVLTSDLDSEEQARGLVNDSTIRHGWTITLVGDDSGCGWDATAYFAETEPQIIDGKWDGGLEHDLEEPREVIDGPHEATWLELM